MQTSLAADNLWAAGVSEGWVEAEDSQGDAKHSSHFPAPQIPSGGGETQLRHISSVGPEYEKQYPAAL